MSYFRALVIRRLGGFSTINDAIEAIKEKDVKERYRILTLAVKRLYNTIGAEDILQELNGEWLLGGRTLPKEQRALLTAEARQLLGTRLWKVLQADVKYQANRRMFILSRDQDDLILGKAWLYVLDCLKTRLESLEKGTGYFNK